VDWDHLTGFGRLLDGHDDLEGAETLAAGHKGLHFPTDHATELTDLEGKRVLGLYRNAFAVNRLPPAPLVFPFKRR
jgi:hypothetical protein